MTSDLKTSKNLEQWMVEYGVSHQNPRNIVIHKICVPAIFWSVLAIPFGTQHPIGFAFCFLLALSGLVFYFRLGMKPLGFMSAALVFCFASYHLMLQARLPLWRIALAVFVVAWVGQFIGHKIEGQKPSFFQDMQFLLVGPLWVFRPWLQKK